MKLSRSTIVGSAWACLSFLLSPAAAQAQITAPREAAQIAFGPISLYPSVQIVDAGKDENVFNDSSQPKQDYTFTLASRALVVTKLGLNELMFSTGSDYVWFQRFKTERASNAMYALRFNFLVSRFKPFIGAERTRTRARANREIDLRARRLERSAQAGSAFNLTERTAITAGAQFTDSTYEHGELFRGVDLGDALSRTSRSYSSGLQYLVTPLTTFSMGGTYTEDIFPQSHIRDAKTYSVAPTVTFNSDAAIRGTMTAGYEMFVPADPKLAEYKGIMASAGLNWSLYGRTTFDVGVTRNVSYSYQDTEPYYVLTGFSATIGQPLGGILRALSVHGTVAHDHNSYRWRRGVTPVPGANARVDTALIYSGGMGVSLKRGFVLNLRMERSERRSIDDPLQNYKKTRLLSNITVGS